MAKYLDELGLSTLWTKIKGRFIAADNPGTGLIITEDASGFNQISLADATETEIGGITLAQLNAASSNILPFGGTLSYMDTAESQSISESDPDNIMYDNIKKVFYYRKSNGQNPPTYTIYSNWSSGDYYGTATSQGRTPETGKIYTCDGNLYIWNGTDLVKVSGDDAFGNVAVNGVTLEADASKDTLNITEGDGITITATAGTDTLNIGLNVSNLSEVGGIISGAAPQSDTNYIVNQVCVNQMNNTDDYGKGSTYLLKSVLSRDQNDTIQTSETNGVVTGGNIVTIISGIDSEIDQLKQTVSSQFTYKVESDNSILQRNATASDMYIIYFVPIANISGQDADSSTGPINAGNNQTYAEYIAVDKGSSAPIRYIWERLGTTDVNIDSITSNYINALN